MTAIKNINSNYTINLGNPPLSGTGTLTVNGNLVVLGSTTNTQPSVSVSPFLTVAANNTGTITDMGLLAQVNANAFAGLRFDATTGAWQISSSVDHLGNATGAAYANIAVGTANVAGLDTQIQFNQGNSFGASANLTFDYSNNLLILEGAQRLNYATIPAAVANSVALYSNTVGSGGTGLYFTSSGASGELVSKAKAIVYSIIF